MGHINFRIFDPDASRWLKLSSPLKIPMDRRLVTALDSLELEYKFETY